MGRADRYAGRDATVGVVCSLATTPVKGLRIRLRDEVALERSGARGNRLFYLIDESARMVNGKQIGALSSVVGDYDERTGDLAMTFPDGEVVAARVMLGDALETRFFSKHSMARLVVGPWAAALSVLAGRGLRMVRADPGRGGTDRALAGAVSLISRASVARLESVAGATVDARRFRMLLEVDGPAAHEEDDWVGREVRIGAALVRMRGHVGRCLVTNQDPESGIANLSTLVLLRAYRDGASTTEPLAFGVYGEVLEAGTVRVGDEVAPV